MLTFWFDRAFHGVLAHSCDLPVLAPISGSGLLASLAQAWCENQTEHQDLASVPSLSPRAPSQHSFCSHISESSWACRRLSKKEWEECMRSIVPEVSSAFFFPVKCRNTHLHVPQITHFGTGCQTITINLFFLLETRGPGTCKHPPQLCAPNLPADQEQNWTSLSGLCDSAAGTLSWASSLKCLGSNTRRVVSWDTIKLASCGVR